MYLLLRNNKQSGPYSLEELKSMGLKAYDLVWLEGKSAAWRYPSEIEELKAFAPAVEEQPFDRFYRRTSSSDAVAHSVDAVANDAVANGSSVTNGSVDAPIPVTVESTKNPGKRIIYVTMPAAKTNASRQSMPYASQPSMPYASHPSIAQREPAHQPLAQSVAPPTYIAEPQRPAVVDDYSTQPIEGGPSVEYSPRRKPKQKAQVIQLLLVASCILALLAAGIFIGLNLNKDKFGFSSHLATRTPPTNAIAQPTAQTLPASAGLQPSTVGATRSGKNGDTLASIVEQPVVARPIVSRAKSPATKTQRSIHPSNLPNNLPRTKDSAGGSNVAAAQHQADAIQPRVENKLTSSDNTEVADKEAIKIALASQVSVGANGYSVGTFGGINDLQVTVTNHSNYPLDLVIVEVQYIQANKKVFKTENLYFRSIGAGSALMQVAPKSSRGVRVQYKITAISSKELGLSYSGI